MDLKIFTDNIEDSALEQINLLMSQDAFKGCKVRIMPDVHAGAGCVVGFSANLADKVIPNIVGVDIGCGMSWAKVKGTLDLSKLDEVIKSNIPAGMNIREDILPSLIDLKALRCYKKLKNEEYLLQSMGSLGGGNHFIEVDVDEDNNYYLVVHTGSRNLGKQVCEIYQKKAMSNCSYRKESLQEQKLVIEKFKSEGKEYLIEDTLKEIRKRYHGKYKLPADLCYIDGTDREDYLFDMRIAQKWAQENRKHIINIIVSRLGLEIEEYNETIHNYIGDDNIIRKGAISAKNGELVLIPMNMRDGCLVCVGKGNDDWNRSAPHGAGRLMSRADAKNQLTLDEFKKQMKGIYTSTATLDTLDEAPMAYKPMEEIVSKIQDTVDIIKVIKPIYNFKASEL